MGAGIIGIVWLHGVKHASYLSHTRIDWGVMGTVELWYAKRTNVSSTVPVSLSHTIVRYITLIICGIALASCQQYPLPQGELTGCGPTLRLDIVSTPELREKGLMGVQILPDRYGMLFVFPNDSQPVFWMHDTPHELDVVYMRHDGTITQIEAMIPYTDTEHPSHYLVRYALETTQGWMANHGVKVGDQCTLTLPPLEVK